MRWFVGALSPVFAVLALEVRLALGSGTFPVAYMVCASRCALGFNYNGLGVVYINLWPLARQRDAGQLVYFNLNFTGMFTGRHTGNKWLAQVVAFK